MLRFYLRLTIVMLPLFVLLVITMSALGSTQPIHPALRGFVEGCEGVPQPCWYGIVDTVSTVDAARQVLAQQGYIMTNLHESDGRFDLYDYETYQRQEDWGCNQVRIGYDLSEDDTVIIADIDECIGLYAGDVMSFWGIPTYVRPPRPDGMIYYGEFNGVWLHGSLVPYTSATGIYFNHLGGVGPMFGWEGFIPYWRYCQLQSSSAMCVS
jgi:hypothetical protein